MADNTTLNVGTGGDVIASDDITGVKFQRIKLVLGADGVNGGDVASGNPLPISGSVSSVDSTASGSITAISQSVALALNGKSGVAIQITGTWVGTLQFEGTVDGTTWVTVNGVVAGASTPGTTTTANGVIRLTPSGLAQVRITSTAWTSGTAVISLRGSDATGGTFINQSLTAGANVIGKVGIDQTTPGTTNNINVGTVGSTAVNAFPAGFARVTDEPKQIFYDPFDAALDTTNTWTTPTVAAPGVIAAVATGVMTLGAGATASGWSKLTSQGTFKLSVPAWTGHSFAIAISDLAAINANATRFWGCGSIPATPTVGVPITDGVGFELSSGKLFAVVYAGGVRTQIADLTTAGTAPTDTLYHRYIVAVRTDRTYWYIDGLGAAQLVATSSFQAPQVQTLGQTFVAVGSATNAAAANIQCAGSAVWDTGKNSTQLSDGAFPWRKQTVKAASTAAVAADLPAVVALHPTSPLPVGANTIGAVTAPGAAALALDATLTGGTQKAIARTAAKGTAVAADLTSNPVDANTQALHVNLAGTNTVGLVAGAAVIGSLAANQSVNTAQINGVAPSMGTGIMGTGVQRVAIASDNDAVTVKQATGTNLHTVIDSGTVTTVSTVSAARVVGNAGAIFDAATAAAVPANALYNGARAATANPTNATGGNMVGLMADKAGRLVVTPGHVRDLVGIQTTAVAATTETTIITAGGAGVFNDLTQLIITTAGAAAQTITIKDATAGTTRMVLNYPNAALAPGSPLVINFNPPVSQAAANSAWTTTNSVATATNITCVFTKNL